MPPTCLRVLVLPVLSLMYLAINSLRPEGSILYARKKKYFLQCWLPTSKPSFPPHLSFLFIMISISTFVKDFQTCFVPLAKQYKAFNWAHTGGVWWRLNTMSGAAAQTPVAWKSTKILTWRFLMKDDPA